MRQIQHRAWELLQLYQARGVRQLVVTPLLFHNLDWNSREHLEIHDAYWRAVLVSGDELNEQAEELRESCLRQPETTIEIAGGHALTLRVDANRTMVSDGLCRTSRHGMANLPAGELLLLVETESAAGSLRFDFTPRTGGTIQGTEMCHFANRIAASRRGSGQARY